MVGERTNDIKAISKPRWIRKFMPLKISGWARHVQGAAVWHARARETGAREPCVRQERRNPAPASKHLEAALTGLAMLTDVCKIRFTMVAPPSRRQFSRPARCRRYEGS